MYASEYGMDEGAYKAPFRIGAIAMAESMSIDVKNLEEVLAGLDKRKEYVAKAVNSTCRDFKSRGPGWISKAVTQEYTIKASEVKGALKGSHNVGMVSLGGVKLDDIRLEYSGRVLTLSHFRYTPKTEASLGKKRGLIPGQYTANGRPVVWAFQRKKKAIKVEVHKGDKRTLTGRYKTTPFIASMNGSPSMPFQRRSETRTDVESFRSVSIPQMITNDKVAEDINERISDGLAKRLEHHLARYSNA